MSATPSDAVRQALDLGFSDYYEGENVREATLAAQGSRMLRCVDIVHAEGAVCFSFFNRLGKTHPAAELYALDFPSDLRASLYVLLGGYYKQSLICLRSWLEMRMLGVYFGSVQTDRAPYDAWKRGEEQAPLGSGLVDRLFGQAEFQKADARVGLRAQLKDVYASLSVFTHGGGLEEHDLQRDTDNVPRYNAQSVTVFAELLERAFSEVMYMTCVAFARDGFADVDPENEAAILCNLPGAYAAEVRPLLPSAV